MATDFIVTSIEYAVRRTNPKSVWPYRIVRMVSYNRGPGRTHKLSAKFRTKAEAEAHRAKYCPAQLDKFC
jgi:hypothetical protein